jgi:hypothetical protein
MSCNAGGNTPIVPSNTVRHLDFPQKQKDFTINSPNTTINNIFAEGIDWEEKALWKRKRKD